MTRARTLIPLSIALGLATACETGEVPADGDATPTTDTVAAAAPRPTVHIDEPADGAVLRGDSVRVVLRAEGVTILPAGDTTPGSAHHHLLLNAQTPAEGEALPADVEGITHLGQAQTEHVYRDLPPGDYTLVAVLGDLVHRVLAQAADTVRFTVEGGGN